MIFHLFLLRAEIAPRLFLAWLVPTCQVSAEPSKGSQFLGAPRNSPSCVSPMEPHLTCFEAARDDPSNDLWAMQAPGVDLQVYCACFCQRTTFFLQPCIARPHHCFALARRARPTMITAPSRLLRYSRPDHGKCFVTALRACLTMVSTPARLLRYNTVRTPDQGKHTRPTTARMPDHGKHTRPTASI